MTLKDKKQLDKAYENRFNCLQKSIFINKNSGLLLFVEYLKYLRDNIILTDYNKTSESSKIRVASIIAAVAEFEAYRQTQDNLQKTFHWNTFCELFKQNMEDWLKIDDSV
jgi:hypothetical protein